MRSKISERGIVAAICFGLIALVWLVFGQTLSHDFVNFDDNTYVYSNWLVRGGLSWRGLARAFTDTYTGNWHPLTLISHMLDCQLYSLRPAGHHFSNVLFHSLATVLLFVWLNEMAPDANRKRVVWRSAFVAAVFAIHPLHVESVAWIAERKDVLSAVFFFLTLIAYTRYARSPSTARYIVVAIFFACGLMSKPMLVTLPVILLLLDYWPLGRVRDSKSLLQLSIEKLPLAGLALGLSALTIVIQVTSAHENVPLPFGWRVENALVVYLIYIGEMFWPRNLAVFYPHPDNSLSLWQVIGSATFLVVVTWVAVAIRRTRPYLLFGWLWYLVMLLPVIGIIQVGLQGHADRYTYLPQIGLVLAIAWLVSEWAGLFRYGRALASVAGGVTILALTMCAWNQTTLWKNSETLWSHTLAVTKDNDVALTHLGGVRLEQHKRDEAISFFEKALAIRSRLEHPHYNLSLALIHNGIATAFAQQSRVDEAIPHFRQAISYRADFPEPYYNLGLILFRRGDPDAALAEWRDALKFSPNDPGINVTLANALVQKGLIREAIEHFQTALESEPESAAPLNNLAWLLSAGPDASLRNGRQAIQLAQRLNRVSQNNPFFMRTLAAAYAEVGQFDAAIQTALAASELANAQGQHELALKIQNETELLRRHEPLRDPALRNAQ